jgi:hypothetical protein
MGSGRICAVPECESERGYAISRFIVNYTVKVNMDTLFSINPTISRQLYPNKASTFPDSPVCPDCKTNNRSTFRFVLIVPLTRSLLSFTAYFALQTDASVKPFINSKISNPSTNISVSFIEGGSLLLG